MGQHMLGIWSLRGRSVFPHMPLPPVMDYAFSFRAWGRCRVEVRDIFQCVLGWDKKWSSRTLSGSICHLFPTPNLDTNRLMAWKPQSSGFALVVGVGRSMGRAPCLFPLKAGPILLSHQSCSHVTTAGDLAGDSLCIPFPSSSLTEFSALRSISQEQVQLHRVPIQDCWDHPCATPVSAFSFPMADYGKPAPGEDGLLSVTLQLTPFLQCSLSDRG